MSATNDRVVGLAVAQDPIFGFAIRYLRDQGFNLPKEGANAREWSAGHAERGIPEAQVTYGLLLSLGLFGGEDADAARFWFQSAADQGHPPGILMLADFFDAGSNGERPDAKRAVELIERAAEMQYGPALVQLGVMYLEGINVEKNRDRSLKFLLKAANVGDVQGQYLLAANLLKGESEEYIPEGIFWLLRAAENGYAGAHRQLGYLYSEGSKGMTCDKKLSETHFQKASQIEDSAYIEFSEFR